MLYELLSKLNAIQAIGLGIILVFYCLLWAAVGSVVTERGGEGKLWEYIYLASPLGIALALLIFG